jgi:hypothetical protein
MLEISEMLNRGIARRERMQHDLLEGRLGVVVVDMQPEFFSIPLYPHDADTLVNNHTGLLKSSMDLEVPVFFIEMRRRGETFGSLIEQFDGDEDGYTTVKKPLGRVNGFPYVERHVRDKGLSSLLFTGVYADRCVAETAACALEKGYGVGFSQDLSSGVVDMSDVIPDVMDYSLAVNWFRSVGTVFNSYKDLFETRISSKSLQSHYLRRLRLNLHS